MIITQGNKNRRLQYGSQANQNLDELMDGAVNEQFNQNLAQLWDNVFDPNTDPKRPRVLTMTIKIVPNERRDSAEMRVSFAKKAGAEYRPVSDGDAGSDKRRFCGRNRTHRSDPRPDDYGGRGRTCTEDGKLQGYQVNEKGGKQT